ncbi:MAG: 16S rRNA (cytosine(1402)-N(4))-methyltransferase [Deltaproteobacteria bacterium]|nr:16S rRNA (cytosine(1402)-N(4))-methyltransferase [Deltaproteobacteria bacterium]
MTKKPVRASAEEVADNPRAASAKLRVVEKTAPDGNVRHA